MQALLGQLFRVESGAQAKPLLPVRPTKVPKSGRASGLAPVEEARKVQKHSDFKGVNWSWGNQIWRVTVLHDDKARCSPDRHHLPACKILPLIQNFKVCLA